MLGLPGIKAGKGQRIGYTIENIALWATALLIEETGVDPTVTAKLIKATWDRGLHDWANRALSEESRSLTDQSF